MKFDQRFFERIFSVVLHDNDLDVEFRCLYQQQDKKSVRPEHFWFTSVEEIDEHWLEVEDLNNQGYDIHFTVVPRLRKFQGKKEHPLSDRPNTCCIWADLDVGKDKPYKSAEDALAQIESLKPLPSIVVESGNGLHAYYLLKEGRNRPIKRIEGALQTLARLLKGDSNAARATRLMRVPNTINWKYPKGEIVARAWYLTKNGHRLKELERLWNIDSTVSRPGESPDKKDGTGATAPEADYFDLFSPHVQKLLRAGDFARGLCPFHDDHRPSFSVNMQSGRWVCFACGREGGWTQFRKEMGVGTIDIPRDERQAATSSLDWPNLPKFDPTKAPKTKFLLDEFIPEGGITVLVGESGTFKSTYTLSMCDSISKGEEFLDRKTRKRRVLYLDNENPPDVLKNRNENMKLKMEVNKRLRLWSMYDERPLPKIGSRELREIVRRSNDEGRKVLIVLDHLSSFLSPGEGGEVTGQTAPVFQELKHLCALGATILVLHHSKKYDVDTYYGSADIKAKCDAMHTFVLHENKVYPERPIIRIACFLKRHGGQSAFAIQPQVVDGEVVGFEVVEDPTRAERKRKRDILRDVIRENPKAPQHTLIQIAQEKGLSRDDARENLKRGLGKLWTVTTREHGRRYYRLVENDQDAAD